MVILNVLGGIHGSLSSIIIMGIQFLVAIGITVVIETPIIKSFKVAENKTLIRGVNIVTNILLNMFSILFLYLRFSRARGSVLGYGLEELLQTALIPELLIIPVVEALFYYFTYNKNKRKWEGVRPRLLMTLLASYVANIASFVGGTLLLYVVTVVMSFFVV